MKNNLQNITSAEAEKSWFRASPALLQWKHSHRWWVTDYFQRQRYVGICRQLGLSILSPTSFQPDFNAPQNDVSKAQSGSLCPQWICPRSAIIFHRSSESWSLRRIKGKKLLSLQTCRESVLTTCDNFIHTSRLLSHTLSFIAQMWPVPVWNPHTNLPES